ncbi:MAG: TSUP family transporter [Lishizhenia sp.]
METLELIGYFCSVLIGIILGLVGGGGSILTTPVLIYFFATDDEVATSYSLFVVGISALIGILQRIGTPFIALKEGLMFAIPSTITAFIMRGLIMPNIPEKLSFFTTSVEKNTLIIVALGALMIFTSLKMLLTKEKNNVGKHIPFSLVIAFGIATGILAGFVGAGGGFLIVPALIFMGIPTKKAIGTSMLVITIQSSIAFLGDFNSDKIMGENGLNWSLLLTLSGLTIIGVVIGGKFSKKINGNILKKGFGIIVLIIGTLLVVDKLNTI